MKTKAFIHFHTSGSLEYPHSHLYGTFGKWESFCMNIFPHWKQKFVRANKNDPDSLKLKAVPKFPFMGFTNNLPEWIQYIMEIHDEWFHWHDWENIVREDGTVDESYVESKPCFLIFLIRAIQITIKQKYCKHEWEVESHISPNSGSEDYYCPKCKAYHHVTYY